METNQGGVPRAPRFATPPSIPTAHTRDGESWTCSAPPVSRIDCRAVFGSMERYRRDSTRMDSSLGRSRSVTSPGAASEDSPGSSNPLRVPIGVTMPGTRQSNSRRPEVRMAQRTVVISLILITMMILKLPARAQQKTFTQDQVQGMLRFGLGDGQAHDGDRVAIVRAVSVKHQHRPLAAQTLLHHMSNIEQKVSVRGRSTQTALPRS